MELPHGSDGKEYACNAGDQFQSLGWEDPLEEDMAIHSSIFCLKTSMDRGDWRATACGVAKSRTQQND